MEQMIALKHVQTLKEVSIVDVIVAIYWMLMGLLVMVCIQTCSYMTGPVKTSLSFSYKKYTRFSVALPDTK